MSNMLTYSRNVGNMNRKGKSSDIEAIRVKRKW